MSLHANDRRLMHAALVATWLVTALVSIAGWNDHSRVVLAQAGITDRGTANVLIALGIAVDVAVGLALLLAPGRASYLVALAAMAGMTIAGTAIWPALWLDPLGPLLKNLPIAAMLWALARRTT
ncbi:MAG: DoxX-like family protein [Pseudomonadota bacterium]